MIIPTDEILKARKQQLVITNEFLIAIETFKWCTLTDIVFLNNEPVMTVKSNLDFHVQNGILINVQIKINCDHPEYLSIKRELIRIKLSLREDSHFSIKSIQIIPTAEKVFRDQMEMYQILNDELAMDKLLNNLICSVNGVSRS